MRDDGGQAHGQGTPHLAGANADECETFWSDLVTAAEECTADGTHNTLPVPSSEARRLPTSAEGCKPCEARVVPDVDVQSSARKPRNPEVDIDNIDVEEQRRILAEIEEHKEGKTQSGLKRPPTRPGAHSPSVKRKKGKTTPSSGSILKFFRPRSKQ